MKACNGRLHSLVVSHPGLAPIFARQGQAPQREGEGSDREAPTGIMGCGNDIDGVDGEVKGLEENRLLPFMIAGHDFA